MLRSSRLFHAVILGAASLAMLLGLGGAATHPAEAAAPWLFDDFRALRPSVWHVTDTTASPRGPYDYCPGVPCLPANAIFSARAAGDDGREDGGRGLQLALGADASAPNGTSGGQIVSQQAFQYGSFTTRLEPGSSTHALNAMFLYNFTSLDEVDVEVTHNDAGDGPGGVCGSRDATGQWEVWFTVWKGGVCQSHAAFPLPDRDFHTYSIRWQPDAVSFYAPDLSRTGKPLWSTPVGTLALTPMHLIFNSYEPSWKHGSGPLTVLMRVDWVAVSGRY